MSRGYELTLEFPCPSGPLKSLRQSPIHQGDRQKWFDFIDDVTLAHRRSAEYQRILNR